MTGKLLVGNIHEQSSTVLGLSVLVIAGLYLRQTHKKILFWICGLLTSTAILFAFYNGSKPEYYYLFTFPPLLVLFALLAQKLPPKVLAIITVTLVANSFLLLPFGKNIEGFTVGNLQKVDEYLRKQPIRQIIYDVPFGSDFGAKYILDKIPLAENGEIAHLSFGNKLSFAGTLNIDNINIWLDKRDDNHYYKLANSYVLELEERYKLYPQDGNPQQDKSILYDEYIITKSEQIVGQLKVTKYDHYRQEIQPQWISDCVKSYPALSANCGLSATSYLYSYQTNNGEDIRISIW